MWRLLRMPKGSGLNILGSRSMDVSSIIFHDILLLLTKCTTCAALVLQVHHVLPSHVSLPLTNSVAPARPVNQRSKAIPTGPKASSGPTQASQQTQRHNAQRNSTSGKKAAGAVHAQTEGAPPGLALLKRIGKAGQEGDKRKQQGG